MRSKNKDLKAIQYKVMFTKKEKNEFKQGSVLLLASKSLFYYLFDIQNFLTNQKVNNQMLL